MSLVTSENAVNIIAAHAANLRYEDLGEMTITRARQVMLDTLGTALGGYQTRLGRLTADFAAQWYPGEEATLVADGRGSTVGAPPGPMGILPMPSGWTIRVAWRGTWPRSCCPCFWYLASTCSSAGAS